VNAGVRRGGYTLIEAVLALTLLVTVLGAAAELLIRQWRFHRYLVEVASVRDAGRIALETLAGELRSVSPSLGDLYGIGPDSVALRSNTGLAVVCTIAGATLRVRRLVGAFGDGSGDSLLVFVEGDPASALDDVWSAVGVRDLVPGGAGGCPDGRGPDMTLKTALAVSDVAPGAPVRGFRAYIYRLYAASDGAWWLGQRLRDGSHQPLAGPFQPPSAGGLRLDYFTADRRRVTAPARVDQVSISVVPRSRHPIPWRGGPRVFADTMSTHVHLRNGERWDD
jgi:hypothetical protein